MDRLRTYNVAGIVGEPHEPRTIILNAWPMTHAEACTFKSKQTPRKGIRYTLIEVAIPVPFVGPLGRGWEPINLFNETRWLNLDCVAITAIKENT